MTSERQPGLSRPKRSPASPVQKSPQPDDGMMPDEPVEARPMPEYGKLRGKKVLLADAEARLSPADLAQVEVDVPGQGIIRPWRFVTDGSEITEKDGRLQL